MRKVISQIFETSKNKQFQKYLNDIAFLNLKLNKFNNMSNAIKKIHEKIKYPLKRFLLWGLLLVIK